MHEYPPKPGYFPGGLNQISQMAQVNPGPFAPKTPQQQREAHWAGQVAGYDANPYAAPQVQQSSAQLPGAANHAVSPWGAPQAAAPAGNGMNTSQRLDAHYGGMVNRFDANPAVAPQAQQSSAQLPGAANHANSPWAQPQQAPAQGGGGGGGGFLSKVASLFMGLF